MENRNLVDREVFEQLKAEGFNRIPVYRSVLADLDTPLSVYLKLADGPDAYLFESVEGGETWGPGAGSPSSAYPAGGVIRSAAQN
jgi:hypothetical protein